MLDHHAFLLVLAQSQKRVADKIADWAGRYIGKGFCRICDSAEMLRVFRQQTPGAQHVAILLAANQPELDQLTGLAPLLEGLKILLMVPNNQPHTMAKAHRLRPRYLMGPPIDYQELGLVISHIHACNITERTLLNGTTIS